MVSHGRALAVAAAWIVLPLLVAVLLLTGTVNRDEDPVGVILFAVAAAGAFFLSLFGLLAAAAWIALRSRRAATAAGLGAQAGLLGLLVAGLGVAWFVATHQ